MQGKLKNVFILCLQLENFKIFFSVSGSEVAHPSNHLKAASNPVPVPGRSRHNSTSSVGSWQLVSPPADPTPRSFDSPKSCSKAYFAAEMIDSTQTIREEVSPCSSVGSSLSITVFDRKKRLAKVCDLFEISFEKYTRNKSDMQNLICNLTTDAWQWIIVFIPDSIWNDYNWNYVCCNLLILQVYRKFLEVEDLRKKILAKDEKKS